MKSKLESQKRQALTEDHLDTANHCLVRQLRSLSRVSLRRLRAQRHNEKQISPAIHVMSDALSVLHTNLKKPGRALV